MSFIIRAIDVGYGNTKYVTNVDGDKIDCGHFPSQTFYSASEPVQNGLGGARKTIAVPINGNYYEVGPDVELAAHWLRSRQRHDGYTETEEYRAFMAGALHFMKAEVVDLLVLGLPVAHYMTKRQQLAKSMTGTFELGKKRQVEVKRVVVVAQPQGALMHYASSTGRLAEVMQAKSLIIDVGSRTFDWLVTRGTQVVPRMSHSVNRGVSDVLRAIADAISAEIGEEYNDLEGIDLALRTGKSPKIFQKPYDIKKFDKTVQIIADQAMNYMCERLENSYAFEHIVLVGGGAFLFRKAIKRRFSKLTIQEVKDPLYANVRGFQIFGEKYAQERLVGTEQAKTTAALENTEAAAVPK